MDTLELTRTTEFIVNPDISPSCSEIVTLAGQSNLPISEALRTRLLRPDRLENNLGVNRYGSPLAEASGLILRNSVVHGRSSDEVHARVFGIFPEKTWKDIADFIKSQQPDLSDREVEEVQLLEWAEVSGNPASFYDLSLLKTSPAFQTEGAVLLWKILRSSLHEETSGVPSFNFDPLEKTVWGNCKDSEEYFTKTLVGHPYREQAGARATIYVDANDSPLFYQKSGGYGIKFEGRFSNATAITLKDVTVNGILVPTGSLVGIESSLSKTDLTEVRDRVVSTDLINSILPLRLTLFALSPDDAQVSFGGHYQEFALDKNPVPTLESFIATASEIIENAQR